MTTPEFTTLQTYNGMDCIATLELWKIFDAQLDTPRRAIYDRSLALHSAALEMSLTGLLVNRAALSRVVQTLETQQAKLRADWEYITTQLTGKPINPLSPAQLQYLFYTCLGYKPITVSKKGESKISADAEALEKLQYLYPELTPLCRIVLDLRTIQTRFRVYRSGIDKDNRMRCSYSIAGTETARWSSAQNAFHGGTNLQNIPEDARHIYIADPGRKFAYIDLEQAESVATALYAFAVTGYTNYLAACRKGDLHTAVAQMVWPELPWTDDPKANKKIAERPYYREHSHRFMCKKLGHGSNYYGKPFTLSRQSRIPLPVVEEFQQKYFEAFPEIPLWHRSVIRDLQLNRKLATLFNRIRHFFGRPNDDTTIREAIAYLPQSLVADDLNEGIINLWHSPLCASKTVRLLAQIHDAIIIDYPEELENKILPHVLKYLAIPISASHGSTTETVIIPNSVDVGWNWGKYSADNPDGIIEWSPNRIETRQRTYDPAKSFLDRPIL